MDTIFNDYTVKRARMSNDWTRLWVEAAISEVGKDTDIVPVNINDFEKFVNEIAEDSGPGTEVPDAVKFAIDTIREHAPENLRFSIPTISLLCQISRSPADCLILMWSLAIETQRAGKPVTLLDLRDRFSPATCFTEAGLDEFWSKQEDGATGKPLLVASSIWTPDGLKAKSGFGLQ